MGDQKQQIKMHWRSTREDPDCPPDPAAHAHTAVSPAGSQLVEGREPSEDAGLNARYRVVAEVPRGAERRAWTL